MFIVLPAEKFAKDMEGSWLELELGLLWLSEVKLLTFFSSFFRLAVPFLSSFWLSVCFTFYTPSSAIFSSVLR